MFKVPEEYRVKAVKGLEYLDSSEIDGPQGVFYIPHYRIKNYMLYTQVSFGEGWEHVSISVGQKGRKQKRNPTWEEMCWIKDLFWGEEDRVVQYHPPKSEYVSMHPYVLHLWRWTKGEFPHPPSIFVGPDYAKK